jgi:hypothetical protein
LTERRMLDDPLDCGACGNACAAGQVCAEGSCLGYFAPPACTACPCAACGLGTTCCAMPAVGTPICVEGAACPQ